MVFKLSDVSSKKGLKVPLLRFNAVFELALDSFDWNDSDMDSHVSGFFQDLNADDSLDLNLNSIPFCR